MLLSLYPTMAENKQNTTDVEKIEIAETFKQEANEFYKEANIRKAVGKYHRALLYLKAVGESNKLNGMLGLPPAKELPPEVKERCETLKVVCYNNLAGNV